MAVANPKVIVFDPRHEMKRWDQVELMAQIIQLFQELLVPIPQTLIAIKTVLTISDYYVIDD